MSPDLSEIAIESALSEEVLMTESVRLFLVEHILTLEANRQARFAKFGVESLSDMARLVRQGAVAETSIRHDYQEVAYLTDRIERVKTLLDELPPAPRETLLTLEEIRRTLKDQLPVLKEKYSVKSLGIFGPYATGQARPYDCLDVLVEFHKTPGLAFFELQRELGETLGVAVHLSTKDGLWPQRAERIMSELVDV